MKYLGYALMLFGLVFGAVAVAKPLPVNETDPVPPLSGSVKTWNDPLTGCIYYVGPMLSFMTPRLGEDGKPICLGGGHSPKRR